MEERRRGILEGILKYHLVMAWGTLEIERGIEKGGRLGGGLRKVEDWAGD